MQRYNFSLKYGNILQIFPKKKEIPHRLYPFFKETILYIHKKALWRTTGLGREIIYQGIDAWIMVALRKSL